MLKRILAAIALLAAPAGAQDVGAQIDAARQSVAAYQDFNAARRAGWRPFGDHAPLMGQHYFDPSNPDYISGEALDPRRPSNLLYAEIGGRQVLVSVAYNYRISDSEPLPSGFAGGSDVWHVHDVARFAQAVTLDRPLLRWAADRFLTPEFESADGVRRERLAMVHLWTIPNPDGPFASHNRLLPYLQLGLPQDWVNGASKEAALGLALATPDGCEMEIDPGAWIANVDRGTQRRLHDACDQAAEYVRARLGDRQSANAAGEAAWRAFDDIRNDALTPAQLMRIAAIVEDGPGLLCR